MCRVHTQRGNLTDVAAATGGHQKHCLVTGAIVKVDRIGTGGHQKHCLVTGGIVKFDRIGHN